MEGHALRFYARSSGLALGETKVQLQTATLGGMPTGVVLQEKILRESGLPLWYILCDMSYTQAGGLLPSRGCGWCSAGGPAAPPASCWTALGGVMGSNLSLARSTDGGVSWSPLAGHSLLFRVYGTVTTAGTPTIRSTYYLNAVGITLRAGPDSQAAVQTSVRTLNRPEVTQ